MPKAEWGVKRTCPNCETRFYDMQREPIVCPECGAAFSVDDHGKVSATRERRAPVAVDEEAEVLVDDEDLVGEDDEEEDETLIGGEDEEEEPAGPALSDEEEEVESPVAFGDEGLIDGDEDDEEVVEEDEDDLADLDDVPGKEKGA